MFWLLGPCCSLPLCTGLLNARQDGPKGCVCCRVLGCFMGPALLRLCLSLLAPFCAPALQEVAKILAVNPGWHFPGQDDGALPGGQRGLAAFPWPSTAQPGMRLQGSCPAAASGCWDCAAQWLAFCWQPAATECFTPMVLRGWPLQAWCARITPSAPI